MGSARRCGAPIILQWVNFALWGAQCTAKVEVGGEVDSMLLESSFLFVGLHQVADTSCRYAYAGFHSAPGCSAHCGRLQHPFLVLPNRCSACLMLFIVTAGQSRAREGLEHHYRGRTEPPRPPGPPSPLLVHAHAQSSP